MIPFDFFRHPYGYFTLLLYLSATIVSAFSCFFFHFPDQITCTLLFLPSSPPNLAMVYFYFFGFWSYSKIWCHIWRFEVEASDESTFLFHLRIQLQIFICEFTSNNWRNNIPLRHISPLSESSITMATHSLGTDLRRPMKTQKSQVIPYSP